MENKVAILRRLLRLHGNWLLVKLLGPDMVSKEDLDELKKYKRPPLGNEVDLIGRSFSLGRLSAIFKKEAYSAVELEKLSKLDKYRYSTSDKLAIREVKLRMAGRIQVAVNSAMESAESKVVNASSDLFENTTVRETLIDEVSLALKEKKTRQQLASSVSNNVKAELARDIKRIAVTEMHRAKQRGVAMAIANKLDIYKDSDGVESEVSVVPNRGACGDCKNLYLDDAGNPRVFKLRDLIARGSNADPGVKHTVGANGLRTGWKAVMPPAHPNCFCELTYLPPGMMWRQAKLVSEIQKAYDPTSMSATIKPPGPPKKGVSLPKPGNVAGLPALGGSSVEPKAAAAASAAADPIAETGGPAKDLVPCPFGGGPECKQARGSGAPEHRRGGDSMQEHAKYMGKPSTPNDPDTAEHTTPEQVAAQKQHARDWSKEAHPDSVTIGHLESSDIVSWEDLGDVKEAAEGVTNGAKRIDTKDNGSGIMKPAGSATGIDVRHEKAGYKLFAMSGSDRCKPTTHRMVEGKLHSVQGWNYGAISAGKLYKIVKGDNAPSYRDLVRFLLEKTTDREQLVENLSEIAIHDIMMNNTDRHFNNIMISEDFNSAHAIDHGFSFGLGLDSLRNDCHDAMNENNMKVKVPPAKKEWMNKTTFSDLKRALGSDLEEWRVGQTYLRMKYILQVEDKLGHLPYSEFAWGDRDGSSNEKFESFVIDYIDAHSSNPESPEYASAVQLKELGVLMDPEGNIWGRKDATNMRMKGEQYAYEVFARSNKYIKQPGNEALKAKLSKQEDAAREVYIKRYNPVIQEKRTVANKLLFENIKLSQSLDNLNGLRDELMDKYNQTDDPSILSKYNKVASDLGNIETKIKQNKEEISLFENEIDKLESTKQLALKSVRKKLFVRVVPPGQEKIHAELIEKFLAAQKNEIPKKAPVSAKEKYAGVRPKKRVAAANIEQQKRAADLEGLGWNNRERGRK